MELLELIKDALDKVKATDVKIYDLRGISPLSDFTVIATVDVARQANSCIDYLHDGEQNKKIKIRHPRNQGRDQRIGVHHAAIIFSVNFFPRSAFNQ